MSLQVECKTFYQLDTFKTPPRSSNFNNGIYKLAVGGNPWRSSAYSLYSRIMKWNNLLQDHLLQRYPQTQTCVSTKYPLAINSDPGPQITEQEANIISFNGPNGSESRCVHKHQTHIRYINIHSETTSSRRGWERWRKNKRQRRKERHGQVMEVRGRSPALDEIFICFEWIIDGAQKTDAATTDKRWERAKCCWKNTSYQEWSLIFLIRRAATEAGNLIPMLVNYAQLETKRTRKR